MLVANNPTDYGLDSPEWYPYQRELVQSILDWYEGDKRFLIISAPTGTGKSLLSLATQRALNKRVHTVVSTLRLQDQMRSSYRHAPVLKGRDNYDCQIVDVPVSQAPCQVGFQCDVRDTCPYFVDRESAYKSDYAVLNYTLYMNLREFSDDFPTPDIMFCDEAHLINAEVEKYTTATITDREIAAQGWRRPRDESVMGLAQWAEYNLPNVKEKLKSTLRQIMAITGGFKGDRIKGNAKSYGRAVAQYNKMRQLERTLELMVAAGQDTEDGKSWVYEKTGMTHVLRPTFVDEYTWQLFGTKPRVVLMSATINEDEVARLGIDDYDFVEVGSSYASERRPIYYRPVGSVTMGSEQRLWANIMSEIDQIIEEHFSQGHKGIIHSVSYDRARKIKESSVFSDRIMIHDATNKDTVIAQYKESDEPVVLVSPSIMEGEDFPGDECRFIIIPKVPYASMGDKVVREKIKNDPDWYTWQALINLIQACGRGMRSQDDWSMTYILDSQFEKVLTEHDGDVPEWFLSAVVRGSS